VITEKIKAWLSKSSSAKLNKIKKQVGAITRDAQPISTKTTQHLTQCLRLMEAESTRLRAQATEYTDYSLKGETWAQGVALASYAQALATHLSNTELRAEEEQATKLWAQTALSTCSRDHHIVGPAMIANAAFYERAGNKHQAQLIYAAVLEDFQAVLEEVEESEAALDDTDITALQALKDAATKLIDLEES